MLDAAEKPCFSNALTEPFEAKPCRKNAAKTWDSQLAQKIFFFPRNLHCMETKSILVSRFNRARINLGDCVLRNLSSLASTLREISDGEGGQVHSRVEIGAGDVLDLLFREMRRRPEWGISEWGGWWQDPALLLITLRGPVDCGDQLIGVDLNK